MAARNDQAGFTLLELLVVTMLSALVLMTVTEGLRYAGSVRSRLHAAAERHDEVFAARRMIIRVVAGALPVFRSAVYSDRRLAFEGLPDSLTVVGWLPDAPRIGTCWRREVVCLRGRQHDVPLPRLAPRFAIVLE